MRESVSCASTQAERANDKRGEWRSGKRADGREACGAPWQEELSHGKAVGLCSTDPKSAAVEAADTQERSPRRSALQARPLARSASIGRGERAGGTQRLARPSHARKARKAAIRGTHEKQLGRSRVRHSCLRPAHRMRAASTSRLMFTLRAKGRAGSAPLRSRRGPPARPSTCEPCAPAALYSPTLAAGTSPVARMCSSSSSPRTGTPSWRALSYLLPAASPATT